MRSDRAARAAAVAAALAAAALPAAFSQAQGINDDVRCLLVSNGFAHAARNDAARLAAAMTSAFYLGRLSDRQSDPAFAAAIRAQGSGMPAKQAVAIMRACADRASAAKQKMMAAATAAQRAKR